MERIRRDAAKLIDWGVATAMLPGQTVSGDRHLVKPLDDAVLIAVVDGLGHGAEAAEASETAIKVLETYTRRDSLMRLVDRCHHDLKRTRGAVMSLAVIDGQERTMTWLGIGDVDGVLLRADPAVVPPREAILTRGGVVGFRMPYLKASIVALAPGDTVLLATDGIQNQFADNLRPLADPQRLADEILARFRKETDDALVLAARFRGAP